MSALTVIGTTLQAALGGTVVKAFEKLFQFFAGYMGVQWATRLTAVTLIATIYLACVSAFITYVAPLWLALLGTAYGQFLGLLFPPISGTIVTGLVAYRMCVVGVKYTTSLIKMAVG